MSNESDVEVVVQTRGGIDTTDRTYAEEKVEHLMSVAPGKVLFARVDLTMHEDPARERPAYAQAEFDVDGRLVRAHVTAATMHEAIDLLEDRLRVRLERAAHREESKHLRHRGDGASEWHHGDFAATRPPYFPRPVDEREIVRRKTFAVGEMTPDEAAFELELLDHDFYLFHNLETGEDNVIAREGGSAYELLEPSATCALGETAATIRHSDRRPPRLDTDSAVELLDISDSPFVFFLDPDDGRGRLLYRRYDGNYGLIRPS